MFLTYNNVMEHDMKKKKIEQKYRYLDDPWVPSIENEIKEINEINETKPAKEKRSYSKKHKKNPFITPPSLPPVWNKTTNDNFKTMSEKIDEPSYKDNILKWSLVTNVILLLFFFTQPFLNSDIVQILFASTLIVPSCIGLVGVLLTMIFKNKKKSHV